MPNRIEVAFKPYLNDPVGMKALKKANSYLGIDVRDIRTVKVYLIDADITFKQLMDTFLGTYYDPVTQITSLDKPLVHEINMPWHWIIEVGFKPGVTDNEGKIAANALELILERRLNQNEGVYTSVQYCIKANLSRDLVERLAYQVLANDLINRVTITSHEEFKGLWTAEKSLFYFVPRVKAEKEIKIREIPLANLSAEELIKYSKEMLLALTLEEMKKIREYFINKAAERKSLGFPENPLDAELEAIAQTWSEHCKHKIFNATISYNDGEKEYTINSLFDTYIKGATKKVREQQGDRDFCLNIFKDNAGVIDFDDNYAVAFKVETHNSPSALDPYGGALTGIVGVNRDPFGTGMGAKLIFNTDVFCFASPDYSGEIPKGLLHPKRIFEGVREGVEHGGNQSGIPTVNGSILFDDRFLGKPLVFCGTGGIIPKKINSVVGYEKKAFEGDLIVMCGGRVGKDGIHGATFSSEELHEGSPVTAVQIGDAFTQRKMFDFLLKARDMLLYNSITDNGAGGLSSSVGEMAQDTGGFEMNLEKPPLKYAGLDPWEILVSESQERMTLAVPPYKIEKFLDLAKKMDVEATIVGKFSSNGKFLCFYDNKPVTCIDMDFIHNGAPEMKLQARWEKPVYDEPSFKEPDNLGDELKKLLSLYNICSKEYVVRQYDHEVQAGSVVKPLTGKYLDGPSDASVTMPVSGLMRGLVVSHGICPKFSDIDTYHMAQLAFDEAVRNAICVGANPEFMAGLDNFCWCDPVKSEKTPDGEYKLAQLVRANQGLYDICVSYNIPLISGKDSMKNDAIIAGKKISIPPTLLISLIAPVDDVRKSVTMDVKNPGDLVYVVGITRNETGGSEYLRQKGFIGNNVPVVHLDEAKAIYTRIYKAIQAGLIRSCHDCSDGGLGVALAESAFSGGFGMEIDFDKIPLESPFRYDYVLFSETPSRFVVTINPSKKDDFEKIMDGTIFAYAGKVTEQNSLRIFSKDNIIIDEDLDILKDIWKKPLMW